MEMPKWEDLEKIGLGLGALATGLWGGVKLAIRAQVKKQTHETIIEEDRPRKITRKEWHDFRDKVDLHGRKISLHKRKLDVLRAGCEENEERILKLQRDHDENIKSVAKLTEMMGRIDERLEGMKNLQELSNIQADEARKEILRRLDLRGVPRES